MQKGKNFVNPRRAASARYFCFLQRSSVYQCITEQPRMVYLSITDNVRRAIECYAGLSKDRINWKSIGSLVSDYQDQEDADDHGTRQGFESEANCISHKSLLYIIDAINSLDDQSIALIDVMKNISVYVAPKQQPKPKSPEYLELMKRLSQKQKEQEYQELIGNTKVEEGEYLTPSYEAKAVKEQLSTIVNILISVASVFWAVWHWSGSSTRMPLSWRTLLSLFTSILVLVAEVVVYTRYKAKVEDARTIERNKKEKKQVVNSYEFGSKSLPDLTKLDKQAKLTQKLRKRNNAK